MQRRITYNYDTDQGNYEIVVGTSYTDDTKAFVRVTLLTPLDETIYKAEDYGKTWGLFTGVWPPDNPSAMRDGLDGYLLGDKDFTHFEINQVVLELMQELGHVFQTQVSVEGTLKSIDWPWVYARRAAWGQLWTPFLDALNNWDDQQLRLFFYEATKCSESPFARRLKDAMEAYGGFWGQP